MKVFGSQILAEFINCQVDLLSSKTDLTEILRQGIKKHKLELKSINSFQFEPMGVTAIAIIGESHVAIHTYPEAKHASIDIFTCSPGSPGPLLLLDYLKQAFNPQEVRHKTIHRGSKVAVKEKDYLLNFSKGGFDIRYHIEKVLLDQRTPYQHLQIIQNKNFGKMLFLDHELQITSKDADLYYQALLAPLIKGLPYLDKIAILGGGDGGALNTLLQHKAQEVYLVDIDPEVIQAAQDFLPEICGKAFEHPNAHIVIGEAKSFIAQNKGFDGIVYDLTTAPEVSAALDKTSYFDMLFEGIEKSLKPGGIVSLQCCSIYDEANYQDIKTMLEKYFAKIDFQDTFIPSFGGKWRFASALKP